MDVGEAVTKPFTTLKNYAPAVKADAYEKFLTTDFDLTDIAISVGVPKSIVAAWSREGNWVKRKEELELELFRSAESKYRNFLLEFKLPTILRHIETAKLIEDQIAALVNEKLKNGGNLDSAELRRLSEALSSVSSVSARAIGLGEKQSIELSKQETAGGKRALIAIGISPQLSQSMEVKVTETTIDVPSGETKGEQG